VQRHISQTACVRVLEPCPALKLAACLLKQSGSKAYNQVCMLQLHSIVDMTQSGVGSDASEGRTWTCVLRLAAAVRMAAATEVILVATLAGSRRHTPLRVSGGSRAGLGSGRSVKNLWGHRTHGCHWEDEVNITWTSLGGWGE
jgi:hypothetical protein